MLHVAHRRFSDMGMDDRGMRRCHLHLHHVFGTTRFPSTRPAPLPKLRPSCAAHGSEAKFVRQPRASPCSSASASAPASQPVRPFPPLPTAPRLSPNRRASGPAALVAAADGLTFAIWRHNNFHVVPVVILGHVYVNSFMVVMNSRRAARELAHPDGGCLWGDDDDDTCAGHERGVRALEVEVNIERQRRADSVMMISFAVRRGF
jgi:hypothetical protein